MSPPHRLRRRKNEDPDVRIREEVTSRTQRQDQAVFMHYGTRSCNGGGGSICSPIRRLLLLNYIVTPDLSLLCDHCNCFFIVGNKAQTL